VLDEGVDVPHRRTLHLPPGKVYMKPIVVQKWLESERGWGSRPDGFSLHLTAADCEAYRKKYWDDERKSNTSGETPDEYSRECGPPILLDVEDVVYDAIIAAKKNKGIRVYCRNLDDLTLEFKVRSIEDVANEYAALLENDVTLAIWVWEEAPKEFISLAGVDKYRWLVYVPASFVKQKLPLGKSAKTLSLKNKSEIRFIK